MPSHYKRGKNDESKDSKSADIYIYMHTAAIYIYTHTPFKENNVDNVNNGNRMGNLKMKKNDDKESQI